jgi:hypothetical protein
LYIEKPVSVDRVHKYNDDYNKLKAISEKIKISKVTLDPNGYKLLC